MEEELNIEEGDTSFWEGSIVTKKVECKFEMPDEENFNIYHLLVREDCRGEGLGSKVLKIVEEEARKREADFLHVQIGDPDGRGKSFLRKHNFDRISRYEKNNSMMVDGSKKL